MCYGSDFVILAGIAAIVAGVMTIGIKIDHYHGTQAGLFVNVNKPTNDHTSNQIEESMISKVKAIVNLIEIIKQYECCIKSIEPITHSACDLPYYNYADIGLTFPNHIQYSDFKELKEDFIGYITLHFSVDEINQMSKTYSNDLNEYIEDLRGPHKDLSGLKRTYEDL